MAMRALLAPLAAVLLLTAAGCASDGVQVSTSADPLASFPAQATFAWNDAASRMPADPRLQALGLDALIKQAANEAFAARGYREAASGPANYALAYQVAEDRWLGPEGTTSFVSIALLMTEANGRLVWSGFGRAEAQANVARADRARRLRHAFDEMLKSFPPSGHAR